MSPLDEPLDVEDGSSKKRKLDDTVEVSESTKARAEIPTSETEEPSSGDAILLEMHAASDKETETPIGAEKPDGEMDPTKPRPENGPSPKEPLSLLDTAPPIASSSADHMDAPDDTVANSSTKPASGTSQDVVPAVAAPEDLAGEMNLVPEVELPGSPSGTISSGSWNGNINEAARVNLNIDDDSDSAINMDSLSSTVSVRSSLFESVEENGRTYHRYKYGKYLLPNDESEQDRLDLQHQLFLLTLHGKLHLAPINPNLQNALDIGTGTGIWAIDFAKQYPSVHVIGTDLSPIQPEFVPPNCSFEIDDAEDAWMFPQQFEYIHARAMVTCFHSPFNVIKSAFDALAPGGYLELQDVVMPARSIDGTLEGTNSEMVSDLFLQAAQRLGRDFTHTSRFKEYMIAAGFHDVTLTHFQWPIGPWAKGKHMKTLGIYFQADLLQASEAAMTAVLTRGLGMTIEEVNEKYQLYKNDVMNPAIHAFLPGIVVYGRKPMAS